MDLPSSTRTIRIGASASGVDLSASYTLPATHAFFLFLSFSAAKDACGKSPVKTNAKISTIMAVRFMVIRVLPRFITGAGSITRGATWMQHREILLQCRHTPLKEREEHDSIYSLCNIAGYRHGWNRIRSRTGGGQRTRVRIVRNQRRFAAGRTLYLLGSRTQLHTLSIRFEPRFCRRLQHSFSR